MRALILPAFLIAACSAETRSHADEVQQDTPATASADAEKTRLMDQIEQAAELPGGFRLSNYARYYTFDGEHVVAIYAPGGLGELQAGERNWYSDDSEFPVMLDGGCSLISIVYDLEDQKVIRTLCNGVA